MQQEKCWKMFPIPFKRNGHKTTLNNVFSKLLKVSLFWKLHKKSKMVTTCSFKRLECWWAHHLSVMSCHFVEELQRIWASLTSPKGLLCKEELPWKSQNRISIPFKAMLYKVMQRESLVARTYKYIDLNSVYLNQFLLRNNKYTQNYVCPKTIENVLFLYIFFYKLYFLSKMFNRSSSQSNEFQSSSRLSPKLSLTKA